MVKNAIKLFILLIFLANTAMADHKPGHSGGGKDSAGCYSGGNGNKAGQEQCPISISTLSDLRFPSVVSGFSQVVAINPSDAGAAVFEIAGVPCARVQVEVVESVDLMVADGASDTIATRDFTYGGSVTDLGTGVINCTTGTLSNIRVGGVAEVNSDNSSSFYLGDLTLRALYY